MIRILISSEIRLYREALTETLRQRDGFRVLDPVAGLITDAAKVESLRPDVLLLDALTGEVRNTARRLISVAPRIEIIMLTATGSDDEIVAYAEAGVCGYVPRDGSVADLIEVIRCTMRGEMRCPPSAVRHLARRVATLAEGHPAPCMGEHITARELQIAELIDQGLSNKIIARRLGIEVSTVKNHVHNVLEKLQVNRRGEAAARLRYLFAADSTNTNPPL